MKNTIAPATLAALLSASVLLSACSPDSTGQASAAPKPPTSPETAAPASPAPPAPAVADSAAAPTVFRTIRAVKMQEVVDRVKNARGSVVVFHLYASWCGPCRHEFPGIVTLSKTYAGRGLAVVALSLDDNASDLQPFLSPHALTFEPLIMHQTSEQEFGAGLRALEARFEGGIPYTAVYDRTGRLAAEWTGSRSLEHFESVVKPLL